MGCEKNGIPTDSVACVKFTFFAKKQPTKTLALGCIASLSHWTSLVICILSLLEIQKAMPRNDCWTVSLPCSFRFPCHRSSSVMSFPLGV